MISTAEKTSRLAKQKQIIFSNHQIILSDRQRFVAFPNPDPTSYFDADPDPVRHPGPYIKLGEI